GRYTYRADVEGRGRERLHDDAGQQAVHRHRHDVPELYGGRADEDALATEIVRIDAAADDVRERYGAKRRRQDRVVDRQRGSGREPPVRIECRRNEVVAEPPAAARGANHAVRVGLEHDGYEAAVRGELGE